MDVLDSPCWGDPESLGRGEEGVHRGLTGGTTVVQAKPWFGYQVSIIYFGIIYFGYQTLVIKLAEAPSF